MPNTPRDLLAALLFLVPAWLPITAIAADEACAGITQKCTVDKPYDKTIGGTVYSCYDCKQALCKDGGNGGLSGTATSSVCTEKATTFTPISLDDQFRGGDVLAPRPASPRRAGSAVDPRRNTGARPGNVAVRVTRDHRDAGDPVKFDEADAVFGKRTRPPTAGSSSSAVETDHRQARQADERDHRAGSRDAVRDHRNQSTRTNTVVEAVRGTRPANEATGQVVVSPGSTTTAVPLTSAECTKLGGKVAPLMLCKGFGNAACFTTDQSGTTHAVCISKAVAVSDAPSDDTPMVSPDHRADLTAPDGNVVVAPLTIQECTGLGGKEVSTNTCSALGYKGCATVDVHGVIRVACIDTVAN